MSKSIDAQVIEATEAIRININNIIDFIPEVHYNLCSDREREELMKFFTFLKLYWKADKALTLFEKSLTKMKAKELDKQNA